MADWRAKLRDRDGLDLAKLARTLRASRNALAPFVANRALLNWLEVADASDELSDRIAEIEHVMEIEAARQPVKRIHAYQDMTEETPIRDLGIGRTAA